MINQSVDTWVWPAFFRAIRLAPRAVYDPFCGIGRVLDAARAAGYQAEGTEQVNGKAFLWPDRCTVTNPAHAHVDRMLLEIARDLATPAALFLPITHLTEKADLFRRVPLYQVLACWGDGNHAVFVFRPGTEPGAARIGWLSEG